MKYEISFGNSKYSIINCKEIKRVSQYTLDADGVLIEFPDPVSFIGQWYYDEGYAENHRTAQAEEETQATE